MFNFKYQEDQAMLPLLRTRTSLPGLVGEFFNSDFLPKAFECENSYSVPAVNVIEGKEDFRIEVAAPGLTKEDFKIQLDNNLMTISSEKEEKKEDEAEKVTRREYSYYSFKRSFSLPESVNTEKIKANYKDGILQVVIPKREESKDKPAREIKIS
jgi:HSP20 family protein